MSYDPYSHDRETDYSSAKNPKMESQFNQSPFAGETPEQAKTRNMGRDSKFRGIGGSIVFFGVFTLLASIVWFGESDYADSTENSILSSAVVEIIDLVFRLLFGTLFIIGGIFILKQEKIGTYFVWFGCLLSPISKIVSPILLGLNPAANIMLVSVFVNLVLARVATIPFKEPKKPPTD